MAPTHIDLNHAGIPLAALALALHERTSDNAPLRFSGVASPEARRAVKAWLSDLADLPDVPGLTTHDKVLLEVVRELFRPDLVDAWESAVERRRLARLEGERLAGERAAGAARIAAAKAERDAAKAQRDAAKAQRAAARKARDDAVIAAYVEQCRRDEEAKPPVRREVYWPPTLV